MRYSTLKPMQKMFDLGKAVEGDAKTKNQSTIIGVTRGLGRIYL